MLMRLVNMSDVVNIPKSKELRSWEQRKKWRLSRQAENDALAK